MQKDQFGIGVDIGGSHISAALINMENGDCLPDSFVDQKVQPHLPAGELLAAWAEIINGIINRHDTINIVGIGIGIPGQFDYENGIALYTLNKFTQLYGLNIQQYFRSHLNINKSIPISFINDASAFALGEYWQGGARDRDHVLALTLGTGLGATYLHEGKVMTAGSGIPRNGTLYDKPFWNKTADDYFSTRWFIHENKARDGAEIDGVKPLANAARKGDQLALGIFDLFGKNLAHFLKPWLLADNTQCLILGGNISRAYDLFDHPLHDGLYGLSVVISPSVLNHMAPLIGAVYSLR